MAEFGGTALERPGTRYLTPDPLGSTRVVTAEDQSVLTRHDYLPFGEEIGAALGNRNQASGISGYTASLADGPAQKFTGKERDNESGLDYFQARYFSGAGGRFTSADLPFADQGAADPQSWNLYTYTRNSPLKYVDRTGNIAESPWDIFNVGLGVGSAIGNVIVGQYRDAAVDAGGVLVDLVATALPGIPAGAATAIQVSRAARAAKGAASAVRSVNRGAAASRKFLTQADFVKLPGSGKLDPKQVRFSQNSVSNRFRNGKSLSETIAGLKDGSIDPSSIKPIRIVERDGQVYTLDNRRLYVYQQAGVDIPFERLDKIPKNDHDKFSTVNEGTSVVVRGQ